MTKKIAAIFAHPDDEVLACGGVLAKHVLEGDDVCIFILATGLASRGSVSLEEIESLRNDAISSAHELGVTKVRFGDFPDNAMDKVPLLEVVKTVEEFLSEFDASYIYTHHIGDMNIDHEIVCRAVLTAARPLPGRGDLVILAGEVNSSTEYAAHPMPPFRPTEYVNIAATLDRKIKAMAAYKSELRDWPHPRSLQAIGFQAKNRGAQAGFEAAEAFMTLRRITG